MELPARGRTKGDLARLHDEMDDLFSSFFEGWNVPFFQRSRFPAIDISEDENQIVVKAEVPGCQADDIDISVHGNTMAISGEKKQEQEKKEKGYCHIERHYGSFRRALNLPADVDTEGVEATCKDGILSIVLPKAEKKKPKSIEVKID